MRKIDSSIIPVYCNFQSLPHGYNSKIIGGFIMIKQEQPTRDELKDFLETVSNIAAASKIISSGIQYVDNASFWQWMKNSYPKMFENGLQNWMTIHPKSAEVFFQTKGLEWDVFEKYHPNFIDINELSKATNDRIKDLSSFNPISDHTTLIQVKAPLSESGIRTEAHKLFTHYPPEVKFVVTQSVYDEAIKQGMKPERFVQVVPDESVRTATQQRYEAASQGNIDVGVTVNGILKEVGKGAVIGSVLYVSVSAFTNYKKYKSGNLSFDEFAELLAKDGAKGGIMGGSMAAINVGVQYAATALGVGSPVTIPVMLVISIGLKKIIDPMFGDGKYAGILRSMKYYTSLQSAWHDFGVLSVSLYEAQEKLLRAQTIHTDRAKLLNSFSATLDNKLDEELGGKHD